MCKIKTIFRIAAGLVLVISFLFCECFYSYGCNGGNRHDWILNTEKLIKNANPIVEVTGEAGNDLGITAKSAILMEASTGSIVLEKNADEMLSPASITKIMTLILIFDAINEGRIGLYDTVVTSEHAKSMGGSQVFLETNEEQTVETLIKCIIIASGNDASVAMAEHIAGSEEAFVNAMNKRAAQLGLQNTNFIDCCGLSDSDEHHTSARDVAIMAKELITKYPEIKEYSAIWMENIVHNTDKGSKEFTLSNTNKLLKMYKWTTGLKTGSTSEAKYCFCGTACKNDIELIAVVMAAPDHKSRFSQAMSMLEYGFSNVFIFEDDELYMSKEKIRGGNKDKIQIKQRDKFTYICTNKENVEKIVKNIEINGNIKAPVEKGDVVGKATYRIDDKVIGEMDIVADEKVSEITFLKSFEKIINRYGMKSGT